MKNISTQVKRMISVLLTAVLLLATVCSLPFTATADDTIVYTERFEPSDATLESDDAAITGLTIADASIDNQPSGKRIVDGSGNAVTGSFIFESNEDIKNVSFYTGCSENSWNDGVGVAKFYASEDGAVWTEVTTTISNRGGYLWGGASAYCEISNTATFTEDQHVKFLKVHLTPGAVFPTALGLHWVDYTTFSVPVTYEKTLDLTSGTPTEGTTITAGSRGGYMLYKDGAPASGEVVYNIPAGIAEFEFETIILYGNLDYRVSKDGVTWEEVNVKSRFVQQGYNGDMGLQLYAHSGTMLPSKDYKYFKVIFENQGNGAVPVFVSFKYNDANETYDPSVLDPTMKDSYAFSKSPTTATTSGTIKTMADAGFADVGACYENYIIVDDANNWQSGTMDFYSQNPITDFRFNVLDEAGATRFKVYGSKSGADWVELTTKTTTAGDTVHSHWGSIGPQYIYGSIKEESEVHYIRISLVSNIAWLTKIPGVKSFEYNHVEIPVLIEPESALVDSYEKTINAADSTHTGTLKSFADVGFGGFDDCDKYLLFVNDQNTWQPGTMDFYDEQSITDFRFTLFDDNAANHVSVYGSTDGSRWIPLDKKVVAAGPSPNPDDWGSVSPQYVYGTFVENADIHYVRISLDSNISFLTKIPGVWKFEYNFKRPYNPGIENAPIADGFEFSALAAEGTHTSTGTLKSCNDSGFNGWTDCDKYMSFVDENNVWQTGTIDFYSEEAFRDYRFLVMDLPGVPNIDIYASVDGGEWYSLKSGVATAGESPNASSWADTKPQYLYGSLELNADIHYLRVELKTRHVWLDKLPALYKVDYNTLSTVIIEQISPMTDRYEFRVDPTKAFGTESEYPLTNMYGIGDNLSYDVYAFFDIEEWTTGDAFSAWKPGSIIYHSDEAIRDYRIKGIWNGQGDTINVYASADGETWKLLEPQVAEVGDFSNPNWGAFTSKWFFGTFKENTDIHYIKIEMVNNISWLPFLPGICFMDYNTISYDGKPDRPESYVNTSLESNYFLQDDEFITFKSGSATTDYDFWLKPIDGKTPKIELSRNLSDWIDSAVICEEVGDGVYSYYDALRADDGYSYFRIDKSTAEFVKLRYNIAGGGVDSERRHYEMPELVEDIEDLDMKKVSTPFKDNNITNVTWFDNMSITGNGTNAGFIGGDFGLVGHTFVSSGLMETPYVRDFKIVAAFGTADIYSHIKAYGRVTEDGEETEIPLMRAKTADYDQHGFRNFVFRPLDREELADAGYNYIRFELAQEIIFMQQVLGFEYFYDLPELEPMPELKKPDTAKGEIELMDVFDTAQLTVKDDGKAELAVLLHKDDRFISRNNGVDRVLLKDYYVAESFIIYKVPDLTYMDIRGYKSPECITDLIISVSSDNENWEELTIEPLERDIYDGWKKVAYITDAVDEGMHYVKIEIPDLEGAETDLMISEIQFFHTSTTVPEKPVEEEPPVEEEEEEVFEEEEEEYYEEETEEEEEPESEEEPEKEENNKKKVVKVVKRTRIVGLQWWAWLLIALGGVAVVGGAVFFIIFVKKRKKAKITPEA